MNKENQMKVYNDKQKLFFNVEDKETIIKGARQEERYDADNKRR